VGIGLDGAGAAQQSRQNAGSLMVRYAAPRTADEVIRELEEECAGVTNSRAHYFIDSEVQVSGCEQQDSASFLEFLKKKSKGARPKAPSKKDIAEKILKTLADKKHAAAATSQTTLKDGVVELISFIWYAMKLNAQKMAREIEKIVTRTHSRACQPPIIRKKCFALSGKVWVL